MNGEAVVRVVQHGWYDVYRQDEGGRLVYVKSYSRLGWLRKFLWQEQRAGRTVFVRQFIVRRAQWSQYDAHSYSGLGYCANQGLDEKVGVVMNGGCERVVVTAVRAGDVLLTKSGLFPVDAVVVEEDCVVLINEKMGDLRGNLDSLVTVIKDERQQCFPFRGGGV